ncbi:MAG: hypothetical protein WAW39_12610 [Prosthecobacter sp.]|uniref:hypothetical protein n=1 Tax=Prosthecobacter sp. TaxID=1965333 RepID=UPI003BAFDF6D
MSETTTPYHDPLNLKKSGCTWVLLTLGIIAALIVLASPVLIDLWVSSQGPKLQPATVLREIKYGLLSYEAEYQHFPIPESGWHGPDATLRTRGVILSALTGKDTTLNPHEIKFTDFPPAKDRKFGLWKDGAEWVLSDLWGEPYYIVLDTNGDGSLANPEYGADQSDSRYAERCRNNPPPATLPLRVLIYSSGKDRNPKTWQDNMCSWYSR